MDPELKNNEEIVLSAIRQSNGKALKFAGPKLKNNKEIVFEAVCRDKCAFKYKKL